MFKAGLILFLIHAAFFCATSAHADGSRALVCSYSYSVMQLAEVAFSVHPDGTIDNRAKITMSGQAHYEVLTQVPAQPGEWIHAWLSKNDPKNSIELVVTSGAAPNPSKIINHNVPFGQEMDGSCAVQSESFADSAAQH
jgi:hypothetical protein